MYRKFNIFKITYTLFVFLFTFGVLNCAKASASAPKHVVLFFSAETKNELFVCGCKEKLGGLSRRKSAVKSSEYPNVVVEVGGFSRGSKAYEKLKTTTLLKSYKSIGYDVINVGMNEYRLGEELLAEYQDIVQAPFISANVVNQDNELVYPPYKIITVDDLKLGFLGVVSSQFVKKSDSGLSVLNIEDQVKKYIPEIGQHCDLIILLADARDNEIERIAATNPDIDVILGGSTFNYSENDKPTRLGKTIIHKNGGIGKYLGRLRLDIKQTSSIQIENFEGYNIKLNDEISDDDEIQEILDAYRKILKTTDFTKKSEAPENEKFKIIAKNGSTSQTDDEMISDLENETPAYRDFTGAVKCAECHLEIYNKWRRTDHADAFITLAKEHQEENPNCFGCHSVGFKRMGGFIDPDRTPKLVGVQCESCHGGGAAHVLAVKMNKSNTRITKTVPEFFCTRKCHDSEWSPGFKMSEKWPLIDHGTDQNINDQEIGKINQKPREQL